MWHQWFGLGSVSHHSGAGSRFRIRLGLGFRMDTWSPPPGPVHITSPIKLETL
ncbi:unnamed protein product [Ophioblennius macclurei]